MRAKMKIAALVLLVLALCLNMTGCDDFKEGAEDILAKPIAFECGKFKPSTQELSISVSAEEVPLLDGFEALTSVDFTNSTCYAEIVAWAEQNPNVQVFCDVPVPGKGSVQLFIEELDLSGITHDQVAETASALKNLPRLSYVDIGSASGTESDLTIDDLTLLKTALPGVEVESDGYTFAVFGQTISLQDTELDLSAMTSGDVEKAMGIISIMPNLTHVELGSDKGNLSLEDVYRLQTTFYDIDLSYEFSIYGKTYTINDEAMDFSFQTISDNGEALRQILPYLPRCSYVDMDSCGISNERMAALQEEFPQVKLVWRVFFGPNYTLRTDAERLLASKPSQGGNMSQVEFADIKYCTDLKYLDIGHNERITDLSFLSGLTKLEVVIVAINPISDLTPLESLHNLEYLEIFDSNVSSLEPLRGLKKLKHLNMFKTQVTDISPLFDLELERLWIGAATPVPAEQVNEFRTAFPDCLVDSGGDDAGGGAWRYITNCWPWKYHERYALLIEQMGYENLEYNFTWNDEKYTAHFGSDGE